MPAWGLVAGAVLEEKQESSAESSSLHVPCPARRVGAPSVELLGTSPLWGQVLRGARCLPCLPPAQTGPREKSWGRFYPHGRVLLLQVKPCPARMAAALGRGCLFTPVRWVPAWGPPSSWAAGGGGTGCLYPGEGIGGSERGRRGGAGCQALTMSIQLLGGLLCTETQQKPWARGGRGCPSAQGAGAGGAPSAPCRRGADTGAEPPEHSLKPTRGVVKQEL